MPTWGGILLELQQAMAAGHGPAAFDVVRRKYLGLLYAHTGRNVILYATRWTQPGQVDPGLISIGMDDIQGLMEVVHGLDGSKGLDLILHSPGGSPEAAEGIVHYLRSKFSSIRVIVPHAAMSAATMLACAADAIVMGKHSSLGPIDPQFILATPNGPMVLPAQAILDQFERAKKDCQDPKLLGAWAPILPQYGPALLQQCENALELAQDLAAEWLERWMFQGATDGAASARRIAEELADHTKFKSHGRPVHRDAASAMGLKIIALEDDQTLQDLVLSVYHAVTHVMAATGTAKVIENHVGAAYVRVVQQMMAPVQVIQQPPGPPKAANP